MGKSSTKKRKDSSSDDKEPMRSRSCSVGKRRESRSKSKDRKKKNSRDRSRKKARSRSRAKKRGDKRQKSASRKRSGSDASRSRSADLEKKKKSQEKQEKRERQERQENQEKRKEPTREPAKVPKQEPQKVPQKVPQKAPQKQPVHAEKSPSPDRGERGSPSVTRERPGLHSNGRSPFAQEIDDDRRDDSADLHAEVPADPVLEEVTVTLKERPFGMNPDKDQGAGGYVVAKVAEGRPAGLAGVKPGWRVVKVGDTPCQSMDWEAVQTLLKNVPLPAAVVFEREADPDAPSDDDDEELDFFEVRADQRTANDATMGNIDDLPVKRSPEGLPPPIAGWSDACAKGFLDRALVAKLTAAGLRRPTLIQRHAIPIVSHQNGHHDLIALAQTGSGKTYAFVIPTLARLLIQGITPRPFFPGKSPGCPLILVLSPTRELAMQTSKEMEVLAKGIVKLETIYGGETLKYQQNRIEKQQIDVCCATPGRLIDIIDAGKISLSFVHSVILDEADQMLEQSLEVMCATILTERDMPQPETGRQTLLFSATMPQKIRDLIPRILRPANVANLQIGHYGQGQGGSCESIKQIIRWVPDENQRIPAMVEDLRMHWIGTGKKGRVVIFTNQRVQATLLAAKLQQNGIMCLHLHGKLDQSVREEVFTKFRKGQAEVLVATNVASRGLDFADIAFVVQYNLPNEIDIYTHRIGRTGRVGQVGCALSYMGPKDKHLTPKLIEFLELNKQVVPNFLRPSGSGQQQRQQPLRNRSRSRSRGRRR